MSLGRAIVRAILDTDLQRERRERAKLSKPMTKAQFRWFVMEAQRRRANVRRHGGHGGAEAS